MKNYNELSYRKEERRIYRVLGIKLLLGWERQGFLEGLKTMQKETSEKHILFLNR